MEKGNASSKFKADKIKIFMNGANSIEEKSLQETFKLLPKEYFSALSGVQ